MTNWDYDPGYGGYYPLPVDVRAGISMAKILDYIIIPELITEFYMELHDISYKEASLKLYANRLPTVHHIDTLMCTALYANSLPTVHHIDTLMCTALYCREISGIMIQCLLGNLSQQWTHGILNAIDNYLNHSNSIAKSVRYHGGLCIDSSCRQSVKDHGILKLGDVKSLPAGNLKCYFLFHAVTLSGKDKCSPSDIFGIVKKGIELAEHHSCKSLSIPIFKCLEDDVNESAIFEAVTLGIQNLKVLKLVRTVCVDEKKLNRLIRIIKTYDEQ